MNETTNGETMILAFDLATLTGWAVLTPTGERVQSGTWDLSPRTGTRKRQKEGPGMRYVRAATAFGGLLAAYPGAVVVYEQVRRHLGTEAGHVYGGLVAELTRLCELGGHRYEGVGVAAAKQAATGKGNATKGEMIAAAARRWEVVVADDNEADALWVGEAWRVDNGRCVR